MMNKLALGLVLCVAGPAVADVMIHDNNQKVVVDCTKDKVVHVHGNDAKITLTGTCEMVMIAGNNAKVSGSVGTVNVSGNDNKLDLDGTQSIKVSGNDNKILYKKSLDTKKPVGVANSGNNNKISSTK